MRYTPSSPVFTNAPVLVVEDNRLVAPALHVWLNEMGYGDHPAAILKKPVSETALRQTIDVVIREPR
jgi:hypothetical protein